MPVGSAGVQAKPAGEHRCHQSGQAWPSWRIPWGDRPIHVSSLLFFSLRTGGHEAGGATPSLLSASQHSLAADDQFVDVDEYRRPVAPSPAPTLLEVGTAPRGSPLERTDGRRLVEVANLDDLIPPEAAGFVAQMQLPAGRQPIARLRRIVLNP
jgi:hypothetical protein